MSKFNNFTPDIVEQINDLDDKLVQVITIVKMLEKRVKTLEDIAKSKGLIGANAKRREEGGDSCLLM